MNKLAKRILRGTDELIEKKAANLVKTVKKNYADMKTSNVGFYDMPYKFAAR